MEGISIIMPTYNQAYFIRRAVNSVFAQTYTHWELIIVNDGCTDDTEDFIHDFLNDSRIVYLKNGKRHGIGYSLNCGLNKAKYELIAYLPSDDYFFKDHLLLHKREYDAGGDLLLTFSKATSKIEDSFMQYNHIDAARTELGNLFDGFPMQLVQTVHRKVLADWETDNDLCSKDYYKMYWSKLVEFGRFKQIDALSCCWSIHSVQKPDLQEKTSSRMKILLVGELSHNANRILALKEAGCELFALWTDTPLWGAVGPITGITDISLRNWKSEIRRIKPDIIYGLLNYMAVPLAHEVLMTIRDIPFVWHFKEGPFVCQHRGLWEKLIDLYIFSDGQIFINEECQEWYQQYIPRRLEDTSLILDGDLPNGECCNDNFSSKLSQQDGEPHLLSSGRLIGFTLQQIDYLCQQKVHIHSYGLKSAFVYEAQHINPNYFHLHECCYSKDWVTEFSKYDAGLLHCFQSSNHHELVRVSWDDLNIPAKMSTFAVAGLPMIQRENNNHIVATQRIMNKIGGGIFFRDLDDLCEQLRDGNRMNELTRNSIASREQFVFNTHLPCLLDFFKNIVASK